MNERQAFTGGLFAVLCILLLMAWDNPKLWDVKLFEVLLQGVALTGLLNMAGAFHFTANKQAEQASANTGKAFEAITAAAASTPPIEPEPDVILKPGETAQAEGKSE